MKDKTKRPLNKREQRLVARLYVGSMLVQDDTISENCASEPSEVSDAIADEVAEIGFAMLNEHPHSRLTTVPKIIAYVKALRK